MDKLSFPWLALGLGLMVAVGLAGAGAFSTDGRYQLPLLTMLIVTEFGFFLTAIGAGVGINMHLKDGTGPALKAVIIANAVLAAGFLYVAMKLWPGMAAAS